MVKKKKKNTHKNNQQEGAHTTVCGVPAGVSTGGSRDGPDTDSLLTELQGYKLEGDTEQSELSLGPKMKCKGQFKKREHRQHQKLIKICTLDFPHELLHVLLVTMFLLKTHGFLIVQASHYQSETTI